MHRKKPDGNRSTPRCRHPSRCTHQWRTSRDERGRGKIYYAFTRSPFGMIFDPTDPTHRSITVWCRKGTEFITSNLGCLWSVASGAATSVTAYCVTIPRMVLAHSLLYAYNTHAWGCGLSTRSLSNHSRDHKTNDSPGRNTQTHTFMALKLSFYAYLCTISFPTSLLDAFQP